MARRAAPRPLTLTTEIDPVPEDPHVADHPAVPADGRTVALATLGIPDAPAQQDLDGIVALARIVTGAAVAAVNLLDESRLWRLAAAGDFPVEVPRTDALCSRVMAAGAPVHVADASADAEWRANPYVDGTRGAVRLYAASPLRTPDGQVVGTLCVLDGHARDLSAEQVQGLALLADQVVLVLEARRRGRRLEQALQDLDRLSHTDALTGLANRSAAVRALERVCRTGGWGLLFVDVDDFKAVNDLNGHHAGDAALQEIAGRLQSALRPHDLLVRWAGDEFVVLLADVVGEHQLQPAVRRLREAVGGPSAVDGLDLVLSVSVGGVLVEAGAEPEQVLRAADLRMYDAKRARVRR